MKKVLSALLVTCILLTVLPSFPAALAAQEQFPSHGSTAEYTSSEISALPSVPSFDYNFIKSGESWQLLAAGEEPAVFQDVSYELADGVAELAGTVSDKIASAGQLIAGSDEQERPPEDILQKGGYISRGELDNALSQIGREARPGTVVFDPAAGTAFKVSSVTAFADTYGQSDIDSQAGALENTYMLEQPRFNEVFKDFSLGGDDGETVNLTRGNITGFAPDMEACVVSDEGAVPLEFGDALKDFKYLTGDKLIELQFADLEVPVEGSGGTKLTIRLSGGIGISNIEVNAKYSAFKGYHLIMNVAEEFYLVAEVQGTIYQEVRIPLFGIDIPFGIGRVSGGLFLIVGIDGDIRIEADAREYASATMGIKGKTAFGLPVSVKGVFDHEFEKDGDVDIAGRINGYVKAGPLLEISLAGIDLIGAGAFAGIGLGVTSDGTMLDINLYASLQIYFKIIGKTVNLIRWTPTLLRKRQMDTGGYRVHVEEAYIKVGRVGGYIEDTRAIEAARAPAGMDYRILVYPAGIDPYSAPISKARIYPKSGWQQTSEEGEFFFEEPETMLSGGDRVVLEFVVNGKPLRSDPVPALFPFNKVTVSESDCFNDYVTGNVAPVRLINYDAQQVAKPGDPADPPEVQYEYGYYEGPIHLQGLSGKILKMENSKSNLPEPGVFMPFAQGGMVTVTTDARGNYDSRNPQMLPEGQYEPVFNGELQIRPGAVVLGEGNFDYSKINSITAVKVSFDVMRHTSSFTFMVNPVIPLSVTRTLELVENSVETYNEGEKIINRMQFDETLYISNGGGTRAVTQDELEQYFVSGWTTQDIVGYKGGKFVGDNDDAAILTNSVDNNSFTIIPVLDENGKATSTVMVKHRVTTEWVWQEHPAPTRITGPDHAEVSSGGSYQAQGRGIRPLVWSLRGAPEGITIDPESGIISVDEDMPPQEYTFELCLEQDPEFFNTEAQKNPPGSNASFSFGFNKANLQDILDFAKFNNGNPALNGKNSVYFLGQAPAPAAEQLFTLTVTGSAPVIDDASHGYIFSMEAGLDDYLQIQITATGSEPITWSVKAAAGSFLPAQIAVDPTSGILTAQSGLAPGTYYFEIKAENSLGSDTQACVISVAEPLSAPVIKEEEHGYVFTKLIGGGDLIIPVEASGTEPISWSLEKKSDRYIIPEEVTIDPATGVVTVKEGIEPGEYYFIVRAENRVGSDTRECKLKVTDIRTGIIHTGMPAPTAEGQYVPLAVNSGSPGMNAPQEKVPGTTIRVDHILDRYTYDRNSVNGAEFIRWNSVFRLNIEGSQEEISFTPSAERCDSYHIYIDMTDPALKDIVTDFGNKIRLIQDAKERLGDFLQQQTDQYVINPWSESSINSGLFAQTAPLDTGGLTFTEQSGLLNYGAVVDSILAGGKETHSVRLGGINGTSVTGKIFGALAQKPGSAVSFVQEGAVISFKGRDVANASDDAMFDLGYAAQAEHEQQMKEGIEEGQAVFMYSFLGHGNLPGTAVFDITTDIAEGSKVNVYRYGPDAGNFTLIAASLTVGAGGVVTYKNNSTSEYLITTQTISGALVSDALDQHGSPELPVLLIVAVVILAAAALGLLSWIIIRGRRRRKGI